MTGRGARRAMFGLLAVVLSAWGTIWVVNAWRSHAGMAAARRAMARGDFVAAAERLALRVAGRPGDGEAALLLGECFEVMGRPDEALAAWSRLPGDPAAALQRGRLAIERGQFATAENSLRVAIEHRGPEAAEARIRLLRLFWRECRFDESAALIVVQWCDLERGGRLSTGEAVDLLRGHLSLDLEAFPVAEIDADLRRASLLAPDDDRVVLARARWATFAGRLSVAEAWLDGCVRRRPGDPVVWRARLDWARAAGRLDEVRKALAHLPADQSSAREVLTLRAWLASRRGDAATERAALERLVALDPGDIPALERLAELLFQAGQAERAASLRERKDRLDAARDQYQNLFKNDDLATHLREMAGLALVLGRDFESQAFSTLAGREGPRTNPTAPRLRPARSVPPIALSAPGKALADLLAADLVFVPGADLARAEPAPTGNLRFRDDAGPAGLSFVYDNGASPNRQLPETMSGGVALLDFDGDGWLDVYGVQGGPFPPRGCRPSNGDRLFRNRGDGTFEDVTARSGVGGFRGGYGQGVAVGDYDNDGHPDLFVTRWRGYALYRNRGDGTFEDATERTGLGGDRDWPTSAAFADLDGDGDLDLYVCHYLRWDADHPQICTARSGAGVRYCDPRHFEALPDHVFRNDGGRFVDVTAESGLDDRDGRGLGVVAADLDDDGRVDLFVANDGTSNFLLRNLDVFRFEEVGHVAGVAGNAGGGYQAGMGVACGDLDGDGRVDLLVTNFYGESTTFYRNLGGGLFGDQTCFAGLAAPSRFVLGFGIALLDANRDGRLDLMTANGHVNDDRPQFPYEMPAQLLTGGPPGQLLTDVSSTSGPPWIVPRLGRGLASGDLDNDGRVDAVVLAQGQPLAYFHNQSTGGHFVTFRLEGASPGSNRDGVGARVTVTAGGRKQVAQRVGGGSYESASDARLHFGLGAAGRVESVEVRWPSGRKARYRDLPADAGYLLREGAPAAEPLTGFARPSAP